MCVLLALAASTHAAETGGHEEVSFWDLVPVVSQIKSIVQLISGDVNASAQTGINFFDKGIGTSQLHSLFQLIGGNVDKAVEIQKEFGRNIEVLVDSIPILGHLKGTLHLINGEGKHGWSAIKQATSSAISLLGGVLGGPIGALTGLAAADGAITAVDMAINGNATPHGLVDYVVTIKDRNAGEHVDALAGVLTRGIAGPVKHLKQEPIALKLKLIYKPAAQNSSDVPTAVARNSSDVPTAVAQNSSDVKPDAKP